MLEPKLMCVHLGEKGGTGIGFQLNIRKGFPTVSGDAEAAGRTAGWW